MSDLQDDDGEEETWSDTVEEVEAGAGAGASIVEVGSDEDDDGEKTPVEGEATISKRDAEEEEHQKSGIKAEVLAARLRSTQQIEVPVRESIGTASPSHGRPWSVCSGSDVADRIVPAPRRRGLAAPRPSPRPIFRQTGLPVQQQPHSVPSGPSIPPRPPSRGQTMFDMDDEAEVEGLAFPSARASVASSREASVAREEEGRPPSRPSSRMGYRREQKRQSSRPAARSPPLASSPSRCPHCTIHSWLPHSHTCPKWKSPGGGGNSSGEGGIGGRKK